MLAFKNAKWDISCIQDQSNGASASKSNVQTVSKILCSYLKSLFGSSTSPPPLRLLCKVPLAYDPEQETFGFFDCMFDKSLTCEEKIVQAQLNELA